MAAPVARAATPEQTYLAARDRAISAVKKAGSSTAGQAQEARLRGALAVQMGKLVGPTKFDGFPGPGTLSPESLYSDDVGSGALDGLMFTTSDVSGSLLVTTRGLLLPWLKAHPDWWKDEAKVPTDAQSAFQSESFYSQSVGGDAAVTIFAPLPIRKPDGVGVATASLVEVTQDIATQPPSDLTVAVDKGGKIFLAIVSLKTKPTPIAACETILKGFEAKADAALATYNASNLKDKASFDTYERLQNEGADAYKKCWSEKASSQADFAAVIAQAQALADMMARQ
jgi:hypothetical protein